MDMEWPFSASIYYYRNATTEGLLLFDVPTLNHSTLQEYTGLCGTLGFVGRRTKGRKQATSVLRNNTGVSITSTKGKLRSTHQNVGI